MTDTHQFAVRLGRLLAHLILTGSFFSPEARRERDGKEPFPFVARFSRDGTLFDGPAHILFIFLVDREIGRLLLARLRVFRSARKSSVTAHTYQGYVRCIPFNRIE